ncbi:MAG: hypothetical protein FWE98_07340 [Oscillospiraceae bacterium]|nr:hypothetical protein [Oscillospiraceae bacterium]
MRMKWLAVIIVVLLFLGAMLIAMGALEYNAPQERAGGIAAQYISFALPNS